jgi:hypothetical protein
MQFQRDSRNFAGRFVGSPNHRSFAPRAVVAATLGLILAISGCLSSRISNLDGYQVIPMNRVVPYPDAEEFRKRAFEIVIVDRPSTGIDDSTLKKARAQVHRGIEKIAANAGASLIDRSLQDLRALRTEGVLSELDGRDNQAVIGADYALATRFSTYRYSSTFKKPFKFLWQSEADIAGKPGTCSHVVEVEVDVQIIEIGTNDHVDKTFALKHHLEQKNKDLDSACTIAPVTLNVMFESVLDDALRCLTLPLAARLAPRGHITEHRKAPESERHLYRMSLGTVQGILPGDSVEIRREQRAMSPTGEESRSERVLSLGGVSDQVMAEYSWVAIDPAKATGEILEGDVVRPIEKEGLLASLSGPNCGSILEER